MALRSAVGRIPRLPRSAEMEGIARRSSRYFSDKGRVLSEEERAKENVYIQKMERERLEKLRLKLMAEKEKADAEKAKASEKKSEGT